MLAAIIQALVLRLCPLLPPEVTAHDLPVHVEYSTESLRQLLMDTDAVLADPSAFFKNDAAYRHAMPYYALSGSRFPREQWTAFLNQYAQDQDKKKQYQQLLQDLQRALAAFEHNALPVCKNYLPDKDCVSIKGNVYFTAFAAFDAINVHDDIVINALHPKFRTNTDYLLNALTHELFHTGYSSCSPHREEPLLEQRLYYLLETLHNEGLATYVAMKACEHYPAPDIREYKVLQDEDQVKKTRRGLNSFFSQVNTMTTDEVLKKAWVLGVQQRGFYVVGADMARKIERERGQTALAETVLQGPIHFYRLYNSLAAGEEQLYDFDLSRCLSPANELQDALLSKDAAAIDRARSRILKGKAATPQSELEAFYRLGFRLLRGKKQLRSAEVVFKLLLELADNPSFAYAYLGEIEIEKGNKTRAREYLSESVRLDENNPLALKLMALVN